MKRKLEGAAKFLLKCDQILLSHHVGSMAHNLWSTSSDLLLDMLNWVGLVRTELTMNVHVWICLIHKLLRRGSTTWFVIIVQHLISRICISLLGEVGLIVASCECGLLLLQLTCCGDDHDLIG